MFEGVEDKGMTVRDYRAFLLRHYFNITSNQGIPPKPYNFLKDTGWFGICYAEFKLQTTLGEFQKKHALRLLMIKPPENL